MKRTLILLFAAVGLACLTGVAAADPLEPHWPDDETTTNESDAPATDGTAVGAQPGQQLAGAVGAQGATVEGELWNRSLSARLANATSDAERASVLADELSTLGTYVEWLEGVRSNLTEARDDRELSEGEYRTSVSELVIRARGVELRANRTATAAEELSPGMRELYGVNATRAENISVRAHDLYQFEDEVGREVANETLDNGTDGAELPVGEAHASKR